MLTRTIVLVLLGGSLLRAQTVLQVPFSESKSSVTAFSPMGGLTLPAASFQVIIEGSTAKINRGNISVVFDPQTGFYFWRFYNVNSASDTRSVLDSFAHDAAIYVSPAGITEFEFPGDLWGLTRTQKASDLASAEKAVIAEFRTGLSSATPYDSGFKAIEVFRQIGSRWACSQPDEGVFYSNCGFGAKKIVSVGNEDGPWQIIARNRWDQEIILDSHLNFVSTSRASALFELLVSNPEHSPGSADVSILYFRILDAGIKQVGVPP